MKLWVLYISASFVIGAALWRKPAATQAKAVAVLCLLLCLGYYVLHLI